MNQYETYSDLFETVADTLVRDDARPLIPGWCLLVEKNLRMALRNTRDNETVTASGANSFVADQNFIDLPFDANRLRLLVIETDPQRIVNIVSLSKLIEMEAASPGLAYPLAMTIIGQSRVQLAPVPNDTTDYILHYLTEETEVDEDKLPTSILDEQPALLLYSILVHGAVWAQNHEMIPVYEREAAKHLGEYKKHLLRAKFAGGRARIRFDNQPNDGHRQGRRR